MSAHLAVTKISLAKIAAKASTLFGRLKLDDGGHEGNHCERIDSLVGQWCQTAADGDQVRFAKRLERDGLDLGTVRPAFKRARAYTAEQSLPRWTHTIVEVLDSATMADAADPRRQRYLDPKEPIPFEQILAPFVITAVRRLQSKRDEKHALLAEAGNAALERSLLRRLSQLCSPTLGLKFSVFQACRQTSGENQPFEFLKQPNSDQYQEFTQQMLEGDLWNTLQDYPVLARLTATAVDFWVEAVAEFLLRLCSDTQEIQRMFGGTSGLGQWAEAEATPSDRHNGGRSVIVVTSTTGVKLVYKPKNLGTEAAYGDLLHWLNAREAPLPLKALKVLDCKTHGWVEFVEQRDCQSENEAKCFYRRAGMLLCLHYILETTDCHRDNLVACGEHPVIVDLETLMHHRERRTGSEDMSESAASIANEQIWQSVLRVGLLPRWDVSSAREAFDLSGLGGYGKQQARYFKWQHPNTDRMQRTNVIEDIEPAANVPTLKGEPLLPHIFRTEITEGFQCMYKFLLAHRHALLEANGPLAALAGQQVRYVFRNTMVYNLLHDRLLHPHFLEDGAIRSIEIDALARTFLSTDDSPFWPILQMERDAMELLDVPWFCAKSDSDSLSLAPDRLIAHCFEEPSYNRVISRVRSMSVDEMNRQCAFIQGALFSRAKGAMHSTKSVKAAEPSLDSVLPLGQQALLARALEIAVGLRERAIRSEDGGATWIAPTYRLNGERFQLQVLGCDLYSGATGVSLFLAALEGVTGGVGFHDLALGALAPLREALHGKQETRERFARDLGIGGASGMGSVVYTLVRTAHFLDEADLLEDACDAASLITPENIATDKILDIFGGSAGAILGLLALHDACAFSWALEAARLCGKHLMERRTRWGNGPLAWATLEKRPLTGFSHGAAGIAYALLRLYDATGDSEFRAAAEEGIAYERQVFAPSHGNWPDFRRGDDNNSKMTFFTTWCHGAPGIGLARVGGLATLDTSDIRREIDIALKTTLAYGLRPTEDHLCCGHFGRMDLLVTASQRLGRPDLFETARKQAAWVVERATQLGDFQLHDMLPHGVHNPGFFTGSAGIGYQLLRLAHPEQVPSALLWA